MRRTATCAALVCLVVGGLACAPTGPSPGRLDNWVGVATQQSVRGELGAPSLSIPLANGATEWTYRFESKAVVEDGREPSNWSCWEYTLTFDGEQVLRTWDRHRCDELGDPLERERERATGDPWRAP